MKKIQVSRISLSSYNALLEARIKPELVISTKTPFVFANYSYSRPEPLKPTLKVKKTND